MKVENSVRMNFRISREMADFLADQGKQIGMSPADMTRQILASHMIAVKTLATPPAPSAAVSARSAKHENIVRHK